MDKNQVIFQEWQENISKRFQEAENDIQQIEANTKQIEIDQAEVNLYNYIDDGVDLFGLDYLINPLEASINSLNQSNATYIQNLETLVPGFKALGGTLQSLTECLESVPAVDSSLADNITPLAAILTRFFSVMQDRLEAEKEAELIQEAFKKNASDREITSLEEKELGYNNQANLALSSINTLVNQDISSFETSASSAAQDLGTSTDTTWKCFVEFLHGGVRQEHDKEIIANAQQMIGILGKIQAALAPAAAACDDSTIEMCLLEFKMLLHKVEEVLANPHLTAQQKRTEILKLMMELLSVFILFKREIEKEKAKNQQLMEQGITQAAQITTEKLISNQEIFLAEQRYAKTMEEVAFIAQIVVGAICTLLAPGVGSALVMAAFTILTATGLIGKLTNDLTKAIEHDKHLSKGDSKVLADVTIGVGEVLLTAGVGAGLDALFSYFVKEISEIAAEACVSNAESSLVQAGKEAAAKLAGTRLAGTYSEESVIGLMKQAAQVAAKTAAKSTSRAFFSQPLLQVLGTVAKGGFKQTVSTSANLAAKEAIALATKDISDNIVQIMEDDMLAVDAEAFGAYAGNRATASITNQSLGTVTAMQSAGKTAASRMMWTALAALGANNIVADIVKDVEEHRGEHISEWLKDIFMITQMALMFIAFIGGSGAMSVASFNSTFSSTMKAANAFSIAPQAVEAGANYSLYKVKDRAADTAEKIGALSSTASLQQETLKLLQQYAEAALQRMIQSMQNDLSSFQAMGGNLFNGETVGIQVLSEQAV